MSKSVRKIILILITFALIFTLLGCSEKKLSVQEINTIVSDTISSSEEISALKLDMDMSMNMKVTGGQNPAQMDLSASISGAIDNTNKKMHMIMNAEMVAPGQNQEVEIEYYLVNGWVYTKMGTLWNKEQVGLDQWSTQNQFSQQIEILRSAIDFTSAGYSSVNGVACYVFQISPDMEEILDWISQQQGSNIDELNLDNVDLDKIFKDLSMKVWIAKESNLLMKLALDLSVDIGPDDVGANANDFQQVTLDITLSMNLYDYNKSVTITLPTEALSAN